MRADLAHALEIPVTTGDESVVRPRTDDEPAIAPARPRRDSCSVLSAGVMLAGLSWAGVRWSFHRSER